MFWLLIIPPLKKDDRLLLVFFFFFICPFTQEIIFKNVAKVMVIRIAAKEVKKKMEISMYVRFVSGEVMWDRNVNYKEAEREFVIGLA